MRERRKYDRRELKEETDQERKDLESTRDELYFQKPIESNEGFVLTREQKQLIMEFERREVMKYNGVPLMGA